MRALLILALTSLLAGGAMAQRGGGSRGGGGMRGGGGFRGGGGGFAGHGGGFVGHGGGGFVGHGGGFVGRGGGFGFRGDFDRGFRGGFGFRSGFGFGFGLGGYWPYWGLNYWPGYYDTFDYGYPSYPYDYYGAYDYQPSPNVTVIYPNQAQPATNTIYVQRVRPETHTYDEYGQEVNPPATQAAAPATAPASSPIYLIAMKDGVIRAAASYSINGQTLHYVTLQHEEKQAPLSQVDRSLSQQLNRERHVQFQLPPQ